MADWSINKHLADPKNICLEGPETIMRKRLAEVAIEKFDRKYSNLPDRRDQKYYSTKDGYNTFATNMKARYLKVNLAQAKEVSDDVRYKWTANTKLELLTNLGACG